MPNANFLNRFTIRQRLYACVVLVSILVLGLGVWNHFSQRQSIGARGDVRPVEPER